MNLKYVILLLLALSGKIHAAGLYDPEKLLRQCFDAASRGNIEVIQKLIDKVTVNAQDQSGLTALILAAQKGHENVVKLLLQLPGININAQNRYGCTALIWAIREGYENIVKLLLQAPGININTQNKDGKTALIDAAKYGHDDVVKLLLQVPEISINAQDQYHFTAYKLAKEENHQAIAKLIQDKIDQLSLKAFDAISELANATADTSGDASRRNNIIDLKSVIDQIGVNIINSSDGDTLLDKAFAVNNSEIIFFLLNKAEDPRELLSRFPFEKIAPSGALFEFFVDLAFCHKSPKNLKS